MRDWWALCCNYKHDDFLKRTQYFPLESRIREGGDGDVGGLERKRVFSVNTSKKSNQEMS